MSDLKDEFLDSLLKISLGEEIDSLNLKFDPVPMKEFMFSPYYLGLQESKIYPVFLEELKAINSGSYSECVFTGSIGSAKTTGAIYTTAYQLYLLSSMLNPHDILNIGSSDEILIVFQSLRASHAKKVDYGRFRALLEKSPYFTNEFKFDKSIKSEMVFPNRIYVRPVSGSVTATIGENVFCGIIDEINFMQVISSSRQSEDGTGIFDQAKELYDSLSMRRQSRFMSKAGNMPGILCLVSSRRIPGEFTDRKEAEIKEEIRLTGKSQCYFYDKRIWELRPDSFTDNFFPVFKGNKSKDPKVIKSKNISEYSDEEIIMIPEVYKKQFINNIYKSMRDIAGLTARSSNPFLPNMSIVNNAFKHKNESILTSEQTDFDKKVLSILPDNFKNIGDKKFSRFIHVDGSLTGDSTGISCGYISGFKQIKINENLFEILPIITFDFMLRVNPPQKGEIDLNRIVSMSGRLRELGLPIKYISYDSFQSDAPIQTLRKMGFKTGVLSLDKDCQGYDFMKDAFLQERIECPEHTFVQDEELPFLEEIIERGKRKIDHPAKGSKDVVDSMAGVVLGLSTRKELWRWAGASWKRGGIIEGASNRLDKGKRSKNL
jgi:hypothetical protein